MEKIYYISESSTATVNQFLATTNAKVKNIVPIFQHFGTGKGTFGAYILVETNDNNSFFIKHMI